MHIEPDRPAAKGAAERFTGDVWVEPIAEPIGERGQATVGLIRFAPGARTAWHSHPNGQTLHVTAGIARMQARGGDVVEVRAGQTVVTPPGEEHWHGAAPDCFMEHLAVVETPPGGASAIWLEHVDADDVDVPDRG